MLFKECFMSDISRIGETDVSDPCGIGYRIVTECGMKVFDIDEYKDFLNEEERVRELLNSHKE